MKKKLSSWQKRSLGLGLIKLSLADEDNPDDDHQFTCFAADNDLVTDADADANAIIGPRSGLRRKIGGGPNFLA